MGGLYSDLNRTNAKVFAHRYRISRDRGVASRRLAGHLRDKPAPEFVEQDGRMIRDALSIDRRIAMAE
jgi:hypothetical protein